jgi:uncharacterized protein YkwD
MRRFRRCLVPLIVTVILGHFGGCGGVAEPTGAPDPVTSLVSRVNQYRGSIGCPSLEWHERLAEVARSHSEDMARRSFFGHINPDGESPFDRMRRSGIQWIGPAGENLALARSDAAEVLRMWLDSDGHRANLEECRYGFHAVGLSNGYWTHLFLAQRAN